MTFNIYKYVSVSFQYGFVFSIVFGNVASERTQQDHAENAGKKEDDDKRVDNGEPVDLHVAHFEIGIPAASPRYLALHPLDLVRHVQLVGLTGDELLWHGRFRALRVLT